MENNQIQNNIKIILAYGSKFSLNYKKLLFLAKDIQKNKKTPINSSFEYCNNKNYIKFIIDKSKENQDKHLKILIFFKEFDKITHLIPNVSYFIYISSTNEKLFEDQFLDSKNYYDFNERIWPDFQKNSKLFLDEIKKRNLNSKLYISDSECIKSYETIQNYILEDSEILFAYSLDISECNKRLDADLQKRENSKIIEFYDKSSSQSKEFYYNKIQNWIQIFLDKRSEGKDEIVIEIIEFYQRRERIICNRERSIFYSSIIKKFNYVTLSNLLINYQIDSLKKLSEFEIIKNLVLLKEIYEIKIPNKNHQKEIEFLNHFLNLCDILNNIVSHPIYFKVILDDEKYIELISKMILSKNTLIRCKSSHMIENMLIKDHKKYSTDLVNFNKNNGYPEVVKTVFDFILKECTQYISYDDDENYFKIKFIYQGLRIEGLKYLLFGSPDNCRQLDSNHVKSLIDLISNTLIKARENFPNNLICRLISILDMMIKYGPADVWKDLDENEIIDMLTGIMAKLKPNKIRPCLDFLLSYINFKQEKLIAQQANDDFEEDDEEEEEDDFKSNSTSFNREISIEYPTNFDKNKIIDSLYEVKKQVKKSSNLNILEKRLKDLKKSKVDLSLNIQNLENKLKEKEDKLNRAEKDLNLKDAELKRKQLECDKKSKEIEELRTKYEISKLNCGIVSANCKNDSKNEQSNDLNCIDYSEDLNSNELNSKEDAKSFINNISNRRKNLKDIEYRNMIRGSIKNLSLKLYASPEHFVFEIIQNTEDAKFNSENKFLKIIIDYDFLIFCSNEEGFEKKNVKSISGLSVSTKNKLSHIGHKGLGFKSIFMCTDTPLIYSKPYWQFGFDKNSLEDEISLINPIYIDKFPDEFQAAIEENKDCITYFYLPLKDELKHSNNKNKFHDKILKKIDENVLLFTRKLNSLIVQDEINKKTYEIIKKEDSNKTDSSEIILEKKIDNTLISSKKFRVFRNTLSIPKHIADEEELELTRECKIDIHVAFEIFSKENKLRKQYSLYSYLPIRHSNLPFIINTNWNVNTSREDLVDCKMNDFLIENLAHLTSNAIMNDEIIKHDINLYLPTPSKSENYLNNFVDKVKTLLNNNMQIQTENKRIKNMHYEKLISKEILEEVKIDLIEQDSEIDLENFGFKVLSLDDILKCCNISLVNRSKILMDWLLSRDKDWWQCLYFHLCNSETNLDFSEFKIFHETGQATPVHLDKNIKHFVCIDKSFIMWRENIKILDYNSEEEEKFLIEKLKFPELNIKDILSLIIDNHCLDDSNNSLKYVVKDIIFIKNNINLIDEDILLEISKHLLVPSQNNKLILIKNAYIRSIFSIDFKMLPINKTQKQNLIDIQKFFSTSEPSFKEILEWEIFFTRIGVNLPEVDCQILSSKRLENLPIFKDLNLLTETETELCLQLYDLNKDSIQFIKYIPIVTNETKDNEKYSSIRFLSSAYSKITFKNLLPSIDIPNYAFSLAQKLGVNINVDFNSCIAVLESLTYSTKEPNLYIEWITQIPDIIEQDISMKKLICLKNFANDSQILYSFSEIYISDSKVSLLCCEYLNKTLINSKVNDCFKHLEIKLLKLGAHKEPTLEDVIETLNMMKTDKNLFINENLSGILTSNAIDNFKELILVIEENLRQLAKSNGFNHNFIENYDEINWSDRKKIEDFCTNNSVFKNSMYQLDTIPFITIDGQLISDRVKLFSCFSNDVVRTFKNSTIKDFLVIDQQIAKKCPFLLGIFGCSYLELCSVLRLNHLSTNPEKKNTEIETLFKNITGYNNIRLYKMNFLSLTLLYTNSSEKIRVENFQTISSKPIRLKVSSKFSIFNNVENYKWILGCKKNFYSDALYRLYRHLYPNASQDEAKEKVLNSIDDINKFNDDKYEGISEIAYGKCHYFNMDDVIFSDNNQDHNFSDIYYCDKISKNRNNIKSNKNYISLENAFSERIVQIKSKEPKDLKALIQKHKAKEKLFPRIVNSEYLKEIGINAELFYYLHLKSEFGNNFERLCKWISSAKKKIFNDDSNCNDAAGYDFEVNDELDFFDKNYVKSKHCYIEVKGCTGEWDNTFHISNNELIQKEKILNNDESYIVVIVEYADNEKLTRIAETINWKKFEKNLISKPETYKVEYRKIQCEHCGKNGHNKNTCYILDPYLKSTLTKDWFNI